MDKTYDRQNTDTDKSWLAFCKYRDMGGDRTVEKVRLECGYRSVRKLELWSSKYSWVKRVRAFDDDELQTESIALQKLRLERRLQLERDAWARRDKLIKKADFILSIPLVDKFVTEDGSTIFTPTDKWRLTDAIALSKYAHELGIFATGGEPKKLDELEAVTILADMGLLPSAAVVAIGTGFQQFKNVIKESLKRTN